MYNFLKRAALSDLVADPNFIKAHMQKKLNDYVGVHDPNSTLSNIKHGLGNWFMDIDNTSNALAKALPPIIEAKKQQIAARAGNDFENYFNNNVKGLDKLRFLVSKLGNSLGFDSATYAKDIEDKFEKAYIAKMQQELKDYPMELFIKARTGQFNDPKFIENYIETIKIPKTNSFVANRAKDKVLKELNALDNAFTQKQANATTPQQPQAEDIAANNPTAPEPPRGITGGKKVTFKSDQPNNGSNFSFEYPEANGQRGITGGLLPQFSRQQNNPKPAPTRDVELFGDTYSESDVPRGITGGKLPMYGISRNPAGSAHAENMQGNLAAANRWVFRNGVSANHERFRHAVTDNKKYFSRGAGMGLTGKSNSDGGFEYANVSSGLEGMAYNPNNLGYASAFNIPGQYNYGRRLKDLFKELEKNPNYTELIKTKFGS